MPEFILNTRGAVIPDAIRWNDLDAFTQGYLEAMFFTECSPAYDSEKWDSEECREAQEEGQADGTLPGDAGFGDLDPASLMAAMRYCASWQEANAALLAEAYERNYDATQAGRDLWFTANGHGVGFWDRKELEPDSEEYERLTDAIVAARDTTDRAEWDRLRLERDKLDAESLGARLSDAARYCEIDTFFQDGRVYLNGFPSC